MKNSDVRGQGKQGASSSALPNGKPDIRARIRSSGLFDADWYCAQYPDVTSVGLDPLKHFLRFGALLRRDPSPHFETAFYLDSHPDVAASGVNPLVHYLQTGCAQGHLARANQGRVALVVHAFHLDVVGDLVRYAANFPAGADQFVTHPEGLDAKAVEFLRRSFPEARLVAVPNAGQDVGALVVLARLVDLGRYEAICKVHTKKDANEPLRWRHALLRGVLASKGQVRRTIKAFAEDPRLVLAGSRQLYLHGPSYLWSNAETLERVFGPLIGGFDFRASDWGFIGGTCFWIRGSALQEIVRALDGMKFTSAAYRDDATIAHCAEHVFGMIATLKGGRVLLHDVEQSAGSVTEGPGFPADGGRSRIMMADLLGRIAFPDYVTTPPPPRGRVRANPSTGRVSGWIAVQGDDTPREGLIRIGAHEIHVTADQFQADLRSNGINQGRHGFVVSAPDALANGQPHEMVLIDRATGRELHRATGTWDKPTRSYKDFQGFLKSSMTRPQIDLPFVEADKRAFAVMEGIANRLTQRGLALEPKPLISVVMPMFDRAGVVAKAIESVLRQSYDAFELLVVDDGSRDDSVAVVRAIGDPRIRLLELGQNRGVAAARNAALRAARGEIICYLDSDNAWDERYLAAQAGAFDELPQADLIYSGVLLYEGYHTEPMAIRYGHFHPALLENRNYIDNNVISHRRSFLGLLGGFDESLRRLVDHDLMLRAAELGRVYSIPMLLCHYYYNRIENTITGGTDMEVNRDRLRSRLAERKAKRLAELDRAELDRPVSVVIPNWESLDELRECLTALQARDWGGKLDVVVVDNLSSEPVREFLAAEHGAGRIVFVPLDFNYGFTYAVNVGIARSRADADILLLNNDAIAQPGAVQSLQRACLARSDAGMTVPRQILPAGTRTLRSHVPYVSANYPCDVNVSAIHQNVADIPVFHDGRGLELVYAPFFAVYIRREVIDAIGPLDAEYGRHYRSDRVYSDMMLNLTNYRMFYVPDSHFIHKLQQATEQLRETGQGDNSFEMMFRRNQWDVETAARLGYRSAPWDVF
ncbi:glycosyltransferase [Rubellimicrobium roseum]|uniref:Glycosyltransferase n=1 Tax=Rubellimicrobium roseum TaxID=687525 RepID=A0A5C4NJL8_9RHOB|nr:glycosyltransferase [Rubellimicrobium roseum]TNC74991.1 glycosyltransferase [Rubellimicrobium roseum]